MDVLAAAKLAGLRPNDLFNAENQDKMMASYTAENAKQLKALGLPDTEEYLSMAHAVGAGGTKKLIDAQNAGMGGANSPYYKSFVSKCCQAYSILRRHAKLLISLLRLAADANIKDMKEQDPEVAILKVQQKLQPEASDAKAEQDFIALINESTSALFPVVIERLHKWALYWR